MQDAVIAVLRATLNSDGNVRAKAEAQLKEWAPQGEFLELLLALTRAGQDEAVAQR